MHESGIIPTPYEDQVFEAVEAYSEKKIPVEKLIALLPKAISVTNLILEIYILSEELIRNGFGNVILERLPTEIDVSVIDDYGSNILLELITNNQEKDVFSRFINPLPLFQMNRKAEGFFIRMFEQKPETAVAIANLLPVHIDPTELEDSSLRVVLLLSKYGQGEAVLARFPTVDIFGLSEQEEKVITWALRSGEIPKVLENVLSLAESPRQEMDASDWDSSSIPDNLHDSYIENLKTNLTEIPSLDEDEELTEDWTKYQLNKDDFLPNRQSQVFVYLNNKTQALIFRGERIASKSLDLLKEVKKVHPEFMPSSYYWDLTDSPEREMQFGTSGFREVFEGISIDKLALDTLPEPLRRSIILQRYYIIAKLREMGIDHGHPHTGNFNVRFLLQDADGKKVLEFDPKKAIQIAQQRRMTLKPIVILRDWDLAKKVSAG
jgi:hypothetical protein